MDTFYINYTDNESW